MSIYGPESVVFDNNCTLHHAEKESRAEGSPPPAPFDGNMAGKRITNVGPPQADTDAATRRFVANADQGVINTALGMFMALDGSTRPIADISFGGRALKNLAGPEDEQDAVTKGYVDFSATAIARALEGKCLLRDGSNSPSREISMDGHRLTNLPEPQSDTDAVHKGYVDNRTTLVRRYHYELECGRATLPGTVERVFHISNTDNRFPHNKNWIFPVLSLKGAAVPFSVKRYHVDKHHLRLDIELVGPWDGTLTAYAVIDVTTRTFILHNRDV